MKIHLMQPVELLAEHAPAPAPAPAPASQRSGFKSRPGLNFSGLSLATAQVGSSQN